jgi:alpha-L-fucosidase
MEEIGAWLKRNGEAIDGARPWQVFGEGPTLSRAGEFNDRSARNCTGEDLRFMTKGDTLYATLLGWPPEAKGDPVPGARPGAFCGSDWRSADVGREAAAGVDARRAGADRHTAGPKAT